MDPGAPVEDASPLIDRLGNIALIGAGLAWVMVLGRILTHRIYVSHDTVINYAHVWYTSESLWHGRGLPVRMPALGHGEAFTFPYGFLPWSVGALLRPVFGDWTVTLMLVLVTVAVIAATFWAFPELRRGWWAVAVLVEPAIVSSPIIGQLPFLTGAALLLLGIGAWRRDRRIMAVLAVGLAQATHPAIVLPLAGALVVAWLPWEPRRRSLVLHYAISLVFALPALWIVLNAPVFEEASVATKTFGFVGTIAPRSLVILVPIGLVLLQRNWQPQWRGPALCSALVLANVFMWGPLGMPWAWKGLDRQPDTRMVAFTDSDEFVPGATYRVLRIADGKIGMYQLLRGGGRLDSEFFPESIHRRSWATTDAYARFLQGRQVDFVMIWRGYDRRFETNEHALLRELVVSGGCTDGLRIEHVTSTDEFDLYRVVECGVQPGAALSV
jgi:hypothetical protein